MSSENKNRDDDALNDYHKSLMTTLREREKEIFKFIATLISGIILPLLSFTFKSEIDTKFSFENAFFILCLISIFILWYGAYFTVAQSYNYRNLQKALVNIQEELGILKLLPPSWDICKKIKDGDTVELIPEFYKPHLDAFIVGQFLVSLFFIIVSNKSTENYSFRCCCLTIEQFSLIILVIISCLIIYVLRNHYNNKINGKCKRRKE